MAVQLCRICEDNDVTTYTKLDICNPCYSGLYYWKSRSVGDLVKRTAQLERLNRRFEFMSATRTNVRSGQKKANARKRKSTKR